jgi:hypothetical protein
MAIRPEGKPALLYNTFVSIVYITYYNLKTGDGEENGENKSVL